MTRASETEGREPDGRDDASRLFPAHGAFNTVVPLSQLGAPRAAATEAREEDETTLVPARRSKRAARSKSAGSPGHSWKVTTVALVLSVAAGLVAGSFIVSSLRPAQQPSATARVEQPASTAPASVPASEAAAPSAPAVVETKPDAEDAAKPDTKSDDANAAKPDARATEAATRAAAPTTRRAAETEPRAERPARAASAETAETRPAPRPARAQPA